MQPVQSVGRLVVQTPGVKTLVIGASFIFFTTLFGMVMLLRAAVYASPESPQTTLASDQPGHTLQSILIGTTPTPTPAPTLIPTATPTPTPAFYSPVRIQIPKLAVDAAVEHVGVTPDGAMDTPVGFDTVGWFAPGTKPGAQGSAVVAGHLDVSDGSPAIFYYLSQMVVGDEFQVIDEAGRTFTYRTISTASYPENTFPIAEVFEKQDGKYLNLITCHGTWQYNAGTYSDRFVVSAQLVE